MGQQKVGKGSRVRRAAGAVVGVAALSAAVLTAGGASASAATGGTTCTGAWVNQTISTNVTVPAGSWCGVDGGEIQGNVSVEPGATLFMIDGAIVDGNLASEQAARVTLGNVSVHGNTSIDASTGSVVLCIDGALGSNPPADQSDCSIYSNFGTGSGRFGNVSLTNNQGLVVFAGNTVAKNLTCDGNVLGVTNAGAENTVLGNESGQCEGL